MVAVSSTVTLLLRLNGRGVSLEHKHGNAGGEHRDCRDGYCDPSEAGTGLASHEFFVACDHENGDQKEWRQQAVDHSRPIERADWIDVEEVERDARTG